MTVREFSCENFRNIPSCRLFFSEGVNLLYGENAQGKTNVLEGIYLFARGRSFRTAEEKELTRFGADGFRLSVGYSDQKGETKLEYAAFGRERRRIKNGVKLAKISELLGNLRAVLFTPDDLGMVKGSPDERRTFLNIAISQYDTRYISFYSRYKTLLDNRNSLLKAAKQGKYTDESELLAFSEAMASSAAVIREMRMAYVEKLKKYAAVFLRSLSDGKEEISLSYESDVPGDITDRKAAEEVYRTVFSSSLARECGAGTSLFGIQRDRLEILIDGVPAREFASQGQQRSIVLAMKLAEGEVLREETGETPVYLFDDVLSELDEKRRAFLLKESENRQIIITSCELREDVIKSFSSVRIYRVENGTYIEI